MRTDDLLGKSFIIDFVNSLPDDDYTRHEVTITAFGPDTIRVDFQDGYLCGCPNPKMRGYRAQITQIRRAVFFGEVFIVPRYMGRNGARCSLEKEVIE